jgi:hypothetical protein
MISNKVLGPALKFRKFARITPEIGGETVGVAVTYAVAVGEVVFVGAAVGGMVSVG